MYIKLSKMKTPVVYASWKYSSNTRHKLDERMWNYIYNLCTERALFNTTIWKYSLFSSDDGVRPRFTYLNINFIINYGIYYTETSGFMKYYYGSLLLPIYQREIMKLWKFLRITRNLTCNWKSQVWKLFWPFTPLVYILN